MPNDTVPTELPVMLSLRELFAQGRTRIFLSAIRIDPYHERDVAAWRRVVARMRPDDHIVWMTFWHADQTYFEQAAKFYADSPVALNRIWVLGNTEQEAAAARKAGFNGVWVNHNAWLDERLLQPLSREKVYRAVLVSQLAPYKRVHLAAKVAGLALVPSALFHLHQPESVANFVDATIIESLPEGGIAEILCRSRVGLMLSKEEGACYASSEYLLCGIPVVTTASRGGRDVFYTRENSHFIAPTEDDVARGVDWMAEHAPDPWSIHRAHVALSQVFRARFATDVLGAIFQRHHIKADPQQVLASIYTHKLVAYLDEPASMRLVG
jgi:glycosyltransferase involved in cell wall biosynthesis